MVKESIGIFYALHKKYGRQAMEENTELKSRIDELKKELESKKNHKFQKKCILIAQILLNEEPVVQGAQHRLHSTGWYNDIRKLKNIINRDRIYKFREFIDRKGLTL
ncbi:16963_t:CDS:2 [Rhizophagus irregularis]|nr:16963_t:CDS:2 [Rhizophagus irregularis]